MSCTTRAVLVFMACALCAAFPMRLAAQQPSAVEDQWRQGSDMQLRQPGKTGQPAGDMEVRQPGEVGQPDAVLPNGARVQPRVIPLQPPFTLTPEEEAQFNQLLQVWENKSSKIKTYKCSFIRLEYNPAFANNNPNQPKAESRGELKYAAPDKGLFRVTQAWDYVFDPKIQHFKRVKSDQLEYWTCDGTSIFQVDHQQKKIIERPIPPNLQGQAITEGPLPFVFGAKAESLIKRYYMRVITPPEVAKEQVWLEARPKMQKDAANYSKVELILTREDMLPHAIQIYDPGANQQNPSRTVITFEDPSVNNPWTGIQQLFNDFARPNVFGYKHEVEQPQVPPPDAPRTAERRNGKRE